MKALTVLPPYAIMIATEFKTIEVRTWRTEYRGDVLITASNRRLAGTIPGHAICVVELADVVPLTKEHLKAACLSGMPDVPCYAWILKNPRLIKPIPIKGKLSLWNADVTPEFLPVPQTEEEDADLYDEYWEPIIV